jgi:hypothetical protein
MTTGRPAETEVNERIRMVLPDGWAASDADLLETSGMGGPPHRWHVNFTKVFELDDKAGSMGTIDVDVIGHSLEDLLSVARRLEAIAEASTFPWSVALQIESDAVRTVEP